MSWILLFISGLAEIAWVYFMKQSEGFTKPMPTILTFTIMAISFWLFNMALKTIPIGVSYSVWAGIGAIGAFMVGVIFYQESTNLPKIISLLLIIIGISGLKLTSQS